MAKVRASRGRPQSENIAVKAPCRVATTGHQHLAGLGEVNFVALATDDRVLVNAQDDARANGIYLAAAGEWHRAPDCRDPGSLVRGSRVWVNGGFAGQGEYLLITDDPVVPGVTGLMFTQLATPPGAGAASSPAVVVIREAGYHVVDSSHSEPAVIEVVADDAPVVLNLAFLHPGSRYTIVTAAETQVVLDAGEDNSQHGVVEPGTARPARLVELRGGDSIVLTRMRDNRFVALGGHQSMRSERVGPIRLAEQEDGRFTVTLHITARAMAQTVCNFASPQEVFNLDEASPDRLVVQQAETQHAPAIHLVGYGMAVTGAAHRAVLVNNGPADAEVWLTFVDCERVRADAATR